MKMIMLLALSFLLAGCITPDPSPSARYYQLQADASLASIGTLEEPPLILVGPIEVSPALKSSRMLQRVGDHEISYLEFSRWASPLDKGIAGVIAENMNTLLASDHVVPYSALTTSRDQVSVRIMVHHFEAAPAGKALLDLSWSIIGLSDEQDALVSSAKLESQVEGSDLAAAVAAQSDLLAQASKAITEDILGKLTKR